MKLPAAFDAQLGGAELADDDNGVALAEESRDLLHGPFHSSALEAPKEAVLGAAAKEDDGVGPEVHLKLVHQLVQPGITSTAHKQQAFALLDGAVVGPDLVPLACSVM